jgi:threonine/homoserine/homoserine lactone efflux protein
VSRTLQGGTRAGIAAALGINAGCVLHALAAALGLAALLALYPVAFQLIQWAGAAYLVWLGVGMLRSAVRPAAASATRSNNDGQRPWWVDFRVGLFTNVLNPKVALFFLAFLPQFVPATTPHKTASFLLLGAWFVAQGFVFLLGLVALAARLGQLQANRSAKRWLSGLGGVLFIGLALRVLRGKAEAV